MKHFGYIERRFCRKDLSSTGFTLVEIIVTTALFMIFVMISGSLLVNMLQNYRKGEDTVRPIQYMRNTMNLIQGSIRGATQIVRVNPDNIIVQITKCDGTVVTRGFFKETADNMDILVQKEFGNDEQGAPILSDVRSMKVLLKNLCTFRVVRVPDDIFYTIEIGVLLPSRQAMTLKTIVFHRVSLIEEANQ